MTLKCGKTITETKKKFAIQTWKLVLDQKPQYLQYRGA